MENQEAKDRGITFRHTLKWIEECYGSEGQKRVFSRFDNDVKRLIEKPIPHAWYPVEYSRQMFAAINIEFCRKDPDLLLELGRYVAQSGINGFLKYLVRLVSVEKIIERASSIWHRYHNSGSIKIAEVSKTQDQKKALVVVSDYDAGQVWCRIMTGYIERMVSSTGAKNVTVEKKDCIHNGNETCSWLVRWKD